MYKGLFGSCFICLAAFTAYVAISSNEKGDLFTLLSCLELASGVYFLAFEKTRNKFTGWFQNTISENRPAEFEILPVFHHLRLDARRQFSPEGQNKRE